jgi:predicted negative regulator of RcsB-dependent stress response
VARSPKIRRKDLRQPDEFLTFSRQAAQYLTDNRNTVLAVVGGVVVMIAAVVAFQAINASRETSAAIAYQAGQSMMADKQYPEAAAAFRDVVDRYGSTEHGILARLQAGHALLQAGSPAEAALAYEGFLTAGPPTDYLRQLAQTRLAYANEARGEFATAQAAYAAAVAEGGMFTMDALLGEARAAEAAGDTAQARQLYERFLKEYPAASQRQVVTARLVSLGWSPSDEPADDDESDVTS